MKAEGWRKGGERRGEVGERELCGVRTSCTLGEQGPGQAGGVRRTLGHRGDVPHTALASGDTPRVTGRGWAWTVGDNAGDGVRLGRVSGCPRPQHPFSLVFLAAF